MKNPFEMFIKKSEIVDPEPGLTEAEKMAGITLLDKLMNPNITPLKKIIEEGKESPAQDESELPPDFQLAAKVSKDLEAERKGLENPNQKI